MHAASAKVQRTTGSRTGREKWMFLGRLHEIETQLNAVASNLPPSTDLNALAEH
jgi:hypothetical protein